MSIFAGISWPEQITVQWDDNDVHFVLDQHDVFIVLAHWNNIPWVDMSLHSYTLSWFQANQSLLSLLNVGRLAEKKQISILLIFGLTRSGHKPTIPHWKWACWPLQHGWGFI